MMPGIAEKRRDLEGSPEFGGGGSFQKAQGKES